MTPSIRSKVPAVSAPQGPLDWNEKGPSFFGAGNPSPW